MVQPKIGRYLGQIKVAHKNLNIFIIGNKELMVLCISLESVNYILDWAILCFRPGGLQQNLG